MNSRNLSAKPRMSLAAAGLFVLFADSAVAAHGYMRIDGIPCEAVTGHHKDWCEVLSFSFGGDMPGLSVSGGGAGKATLGDVAIVKPIDSGTPRIFQNFASGRHLEYVTISLVKPVGGEEIEYFRIELSDCIISKVSYGFAQEGLAIFWVRLKMTYRYVRSDGTIGGTITTGWDRATNRPF